MRFWEAGDAHRVAHRELTLRVRGKGCSQGSTGGVTGVPIRWVDDIHFASLRIGGSTIISRASSIKSGVFLDLLHPQFLVLV